MALPRTHRAFSLVELLISMLVVAILIGLLIPVLSGAREAGYRSVCATNQRQLGIAFILYVQDNKDTLPQYAMEPELSEWKYGGAAVASSSGGPGGSTVPGSTAPASELTPLLLDAGRPINRYLTGLGEAERSLDSVQLFSCPGDRGIFARAAEAAFRPSASILPRGTCFREFGTSYRANARLLSASEPDLEGFTRPLKLSAIENNLSRVLLLGDPAWYFATLPSKDPQRALEASWHRVRDAGNMLAVDGSTRFVRFGEDGQSAFTIRPRGE